MTTAANSVRAVLSGTLPGNEVFAHSFWFNGTGIVGGDVAEDTLAGIIVSAANSNLGSTAFKALYTTATAWTTARIYFYGTGGVLRRTVESPISIVGSAATASMPNQLAVVASLRTALAGRANRGRSYLPGTFTNSLASGNAAQLSSASTNTIRDAVTSFLNAVKAGAGGAPPVIMSGSQSAMIPVTRVQIDSRMDVQRSRAGKQAALTVATGLIT